MLALAFGVGVFREEAGQNRALRIAGFLLIAYAAIGFTGPTFLEMHQRGAGSSASDLPHIILTGMLVLLPLLTIGFSAFALGKRFRVTSWTSIYPTIRARSRYATQCIARSRDSVQRLRYFPDWQAP